MCVCDGLALHDAEAFPILSDWLSVVKEKQVRDLRASGDVAGVELDALLTEAGDDGSIQDLTNLQAAERLGDFNLNGAGDDVEHIVGEFRVTGKE